MNTIDLHMSVPIRPNSAQMDLLNEFMRQKQAEDNTLIHEETISDSVNMTETVEIVVTYNKNGKIISANY